MKRRVPARSLPRCPIGLALALVSGALLYLSPAQGKAAHASSGDDMIAPAVLDAKVRSRKEEIAKDRRGSSRNIKLQPAIPRKPERYSGLEPQVSSPKCQTSNLQPPVSSLVRRGLIAVLTRDALELRSAAVRVEQIERQSSPNFSSPQGDVGGRMALLQAWLMPTPGLRREMLDNILLSDLDKETRWRASLDLAQMPDDRIRQLRSEDRYNRLAGLTNYFAELGTGVVTGNVQRILRLGLDGFFIAEPLRRLTPRNRQALSVYDQWTASQPPPPEKDLNDLRPYVERIRRRRADERARELLARGRWHSRNGRGEEARQSFALCHEIDPANGEANAGLLEAGRVVSTELRLRQESNQVGPESPPTSPDREDRRRILLLLCRNDRRALTKIAQHLRAKDARSPLAAQASYAEAALAETTSHGLSSAAVGAGEFLAIERGESSHAQRLWERSTAFDGSPEANAAAALAQAQKRHRTDLRQYVFLGDRSIPANPDASDSRTRAHRLIDSLSVLLPFEWIVRGLQVRYGRPIDDAPWRDAAARYLAQAGPQRAGLSPADRKVALRLAGSCEKVGYFNQARVWHALAAGKDAEYETRLDAKAAQRMLRAARAQPGASSRREILQEIVSRFPQTRSGAKARDLIAKMDRADPERTWISKADLASWPALWLGRGLRLDPAWFDGETANGELAADGVGVAKHPGAASVQYLIIYPDRKIERRLTPAEPVASEIRAEMAAFERESGARRRAARILDRPTFLLELEGSAGPGGMDLYPRLAPLPFEPEDLPLYRSPID